MFNILAIREIEILNCSKILSYPIITNIKERNGNKFTASREYNLVKLLWKSMWKFLKKN